MAKKEYSDLVRGYILQEGDQLWRIHGCGECRVAKKIKDSKVLYYLDNRVLPSSYLYKKLRLNEPEGFESTVQLTKHVIELYETPRFKTGDRVKVIIKSGANYFPFSVGKHMMEMVGKTYTISRSMFIDPTRYHEGETVLAGEFFEYKFKEDPFGFCFHSTMFDLVEENMERELKDGSSVVIGDYTLRVVHSETGWFLHNAKALLMEAGIKETAYQFFKEHGITVVGDGLFPFVATSEDLSKACNLIKSIIEDKSKEKPEIIQSSKKSMKDIITIDIHSEINTDIIL